MPYYNNNYRDCYNNKNIVLHELIGAQVRVVESNDVAQEGIKGTVADETKNTILIETAQGIKIVVKKTSVFKFSIGRKNFIVEGSEINFRPYERIEKGLKFYKRRRL